MNKSLAFETKAVRGTRCGEDATGSISFPIYLSTTFKHRGLNESTGYDYSRLQNPTREELENTLATLENGKEGMAFSTGVAAVTAVLHLFKPKDHIILSDDLYGGTYRLFQNIYNEYGLEVTFVDTTDVNNIEKNLRENTKGIFIETPSNPMMKVADIKAISKLCREKRIISIVDNTFLTPYFQKPLDLGAHVVVHSGTKYLGGHNDALAGFVVSSDEEIINRIRLIQKSTGACLSPFDSWLILRGIKTLHIRLKSAQDNAMKIVKWLKNQKGIEKVYYIGLEEHEGYNITKKQCSGFGSMISIKTESVELAHKILSKVKIISFAESLGGVESLITYPFTQTHSEIPEAIKKSLGVDERLLRLSVGIEDVNDLIEDLNEAINGL